MGVHLKHCAARVAVVILAASAVPASTRAQAVVRGLVYDDSTGARLTLASVMLVDPRSDAPVALARTDSLGQFSLKIDRGVFQLAAVREGYRPVLSAPITLADGEMLTVRIPIAVNGDPTHKIGVLEHVRPSGPGPQRSASEGGAGRMTGFEQRRVSGTGGLQFDRSKLDQSVAQTVGDFLMMVPGVSVSQGAGQGQVQLRRSAAAGADAGVASQCGVGWFVDGIRMDKPGASFGGFTEQFLATRLSEVQGIEVFRGLSEMPAEFASPDLRCGAVALWTRR